MARSTAPLRIVGEVSAKRGAPSPESRLRAAFRKEARLEAALLDTRRAVGLARGDYAKKHGLAMFPPIDTLRRLFP